ncbi:MAG TPA: XRE family transcriptional regulator [Thermoleophilia bacterium]|nr:XRE family transcriptional regulator [Thermoleophilia bacterium]
MTVIAERIRMARRAAGLSQQALGDRAEVSKMAISKYERGEMTPRSDVLTRVAEATGMRVDYFLRPVGFDLSRPSYRRRSAVSARARGKVEEEVREWLNRYVAAERLLDAEVPFSVGLIDRVARAIDDVEHVAEGLRREWGLGTDPIRSVVEVLEDHGIKVGAIAGDLDFDALTFWIDGISPAIAVRRDVPGDRERYDLCHELGHIAVTPQNDANAEKAAHRFAGAFLVPAETARRELGIHRDKLDLRELHELKREYGLSMQAWIHRAADLRIIREGTATGLYKTFRASGWNREEPGAQVPFEQPRRLELLVLRGVAEDAIGDARSAELLGMTLREFRRWRLESWREATAPLCP